VDFAAGDPSLEFEADLVSGAGARTPYRHLLSQTQKYSQRTDPAPNPGFTPYRVGPKLLAIMQPHPGLVRRKTLRSINALERGNEAQALRKSPQAIPIMTRIPPESGEPIGS
jgi:hypothetical protein